MCDQHLKSSTSVNVPSGKDNITDSGRPVSAILLSSFQLTNTLINKCIYVCPQGQQHVHRIPLKFLCDKIDINKYLMNFIAQGDNHALSLKQRCDVILILQIELCHIVVQIILLLRFRGCLPDFPALLKLALISGTRP